MKSVSLLVALFLNLTVALTVRAESNGLTEDQTIEIVGSFMQAVLKGAGCTLTSIGVPVPHLYVIPECQSASNPDVCTIQGVIARYLNTYALPAGFDREASFKIAQQKYQDDPPNDPLGDATLDLSFVNSGKGFVPSSQVMQGQWQTSGVESGFQLSGSVSGRAGKRGVAMQNYYRNNRSTVAVGDVIAGLSVSDYITKKEEAWKYTCPKVDPWSSALMVYPSLNSTYKEFE